VKPERPIDLEASVRTRLKNLSRDRQEPFELLLTRYGLERMLYRLSVSEWRNRFVLKGAMLFVIWSDRPHRATRDVDLLGLGNPDLVGLETIFRALCVAEVEPDGIRFLADTVQGEAIRAEDAYQGIRVRLEGRVKKMVVRLQIDIGYGDMVLPPPREVEFPVLLDFPAPRLRAYSRYSVVAEKLQTIVQRGVPNSRMKDYYDLFRMSQLFQFSGPTLTRALQATMKRRRTPIPMAAPVALGGEFGQLPAKRMQWRSFVAKSGLESDAVDFEIVLKALREFLMPVLSAIAQGKELSLLWKPGVGWQGRRHA
jgi:predicted nucleotidyltransferase component of viral defense system